MAQQINLYNPSLKRQRQWLTLGNVVLLCVIFATVLVAVGGAMRSRAEARRDAAVALEPRLQALRIETAQLSARSNGDAAADLASRELADLKRQVVARKEILVALQQGAGVTSLQGDAAAGFSDYLRGLARQSVGGLWITGFAVAQGGGGMEVRGRMLTVDRLPDYIKRLNGEAHFRGRQFVSLNLSRSDRSGKDGAAGSTYTSFVLTAAAPVKDDAQNTGGASR